MDSILGWIKQKYAVSSHLSCNLNGRDHTPNKNSVRVVNADVESWF